MAKGINNETRSSSQKKFKPSPALWDGLCLGALTDVTVTTAKIKDDSPMESFRSMEIPRLSFVYESRNDAPGVKGSVYIDSFLPIEHTPESLMDGKDGGLWRWNQMSQRIKHVLEVFREYAPFTDEEVKKLMVDFEEEDKDGVFKEQPATVVVAAYKAFFDNIVTLFKPKDKGIYKDANGKDRWVWMKLLLDIKLHPVNNNDYGFAGYPGEGLIELWQKDIDPSLFINISKGENIEPRAAGATPAGAPSSRRACRA